MKKEIAAEVFILGADYKPADCFPARDFISRLILPGPALGNTPAMETIGSRVKALREAQDPHMTQTDLAGKIGVKQSAITMIEKGTTKTLSGKVLAGLCEHLSTTPSYIQKGVGHGMTKERAMHLAELAKLAQDLPDKALAALVDNARMVTAALAPVVEPPKPQQNKMRSTKRVSDTYTRINTPQPGPKGKTRRKVT